MVATAPHSVIMVFWKETAFPVEELWKDAGIRMLFLSSLL